MYLNPHNSTIHNSSQKEASQIVTNCSMNKQTVVYISIMKILQQHAWVMAHNNNVGKSFSQIFSKECRHWGYILLIPFTVVQKQKNKTLLLAVWTVVPGAQWLKGAIGWPLGCWQHRHINFIKVIYQWV